MAQYSNYSPYSATDQSNGYLDVMTWRTVPAEANDVLFTVTASYTHRPDLLAYDLYQNSSLWWVFAQRNPSVLKDPIYDLEPGVQIYLPKLSSMKQVMGI
jgi:hypothetical protein